MKIISFITDPRFDKPDIIHAHGVLWGGYVAYKVSITQGIPYVVMEHSSRFTMKEIRKSAIPFIVKAYDGADAVIAVSRSMATAIHPYMSGREAIIVPNLVDTDFFILPPKARVHVPFVFLRVANLTENKAVHILIEAFANISSNEPGILLEIGGDGPQREHLESLVVNLGVEDKVSFLGALSREQVREAMWRSNALVLSSYTETFGVVLIEALSTGIPVVATRCGGPEDVVTPDVGLIVEPGNVEELGNALKKISNSPYSPKALRNYAVERYSEHVVASALSGVYQKK